MKWSNVMGIIKAFISLIVTPFLAAIGVTVIFIMGVIHMIDFYVSPKPAPHWISSGNISKLISIFSKDFEHLLAIASNIR